MISIDFLSLLKEFTAFLEKEQSICLATSAEDKVTARTMSHVNDGVNVYFQTGGESEKVGQIACNPRVAFVAGNMQVEAVAEIMGHPTENPQFISLYKAKFPRYYELYTSGEDEVLIKAVSTRMTFYKYIDGRPCREILDIKLKKAFRE